MDVRIMVRKTMLLPELLVLVALAIAPHVAGPAIFPIPQSVVWLLPRPQFQEPAGKRLRVRRLVTAPWPQCRSVDQDLEESIRLCTETIQLAQACDQPPSSRSP
jgi:hypothetical protein